MGGEAKGKAISALEKDKSCVGEAGSPVLRWKKIQRSAELEFTPADMLDTEGQED